MGCLESAKGPLDGALEDRFRVGEGQRDRGGQMGNRVDA